MAGHSKWANIKYRKERQDALRGKIFTKISKEITLAVRSGDPDPAKNAALANAIERARAANMPKENIERAIQRATGDLPGMQYEELTYEGYGPAGVAVLLRIVTDNKNRAASEIRHIFAEFGCTMGGSVAWMFERHGVITLATDKLTADKESLLMSVIDLGAEDIQEKENEIEIYTDPSSLRAVREALEAQGIPIERAEVTPVPQNTVRVTGAEAQKVLRFIERLDDQEDVQEVYTNFDIPEEVLQQVGT
jgi:YebC/PmpR family DNA-binding regulatory protein